MSAGTRRAVILLWVGAIVLLVALYVLPLSTYYTRLLSVVIVIFLPVIKTIAFWNKKYLRLATIAVSLALAVFLILPGRAPDIVGLQRANARCLLSYRGVRYYWGGEGRLGIDCSGLMRRGLINADFERGLVSLNPGLVRAGLRLWWHDSTAKQLGAEYRSQTHVLFKANSINEIPPEGLESGDMAVTDNGLHVLAFVGRTTWVEADPNLGRVVTVEVPSQTNSWFKIPVVVVRWRQLDGGR